MPAPIYVALLHYPVLNREGRTVATAVTNMDVHDISRTARTFGIRRAYFVTPVEDQQRLVGKILEHWSTDHAREYHPDRVEAVGRVRIVSDFAQVKSRIEAVHGEAPEVILTSARPYPDAVSYSRVREEITDPSREKPVVLVFGTGWGVSEAFRPEVHRVLAPVYGSEGREGYNHLSVRAAVGIILDRLFGR